jgi:NAD(P)-dependent dehydrogenase (short-subunit alcohol dehydrogenase family)
MTDNGKNSPAAGLAGATALITGGTSGIGLATALSLAGHGAHVIVTGRGAARGDRAVAAIRSADGKADSGSVRTLAHRAADLGGGRVDILVNNAGLYPTGPGPTAQTSDGDFDSAYAVNVRAAFILVGEIAPAMAARGHGAIVNVLSMSGRFGIAGQALYGSTKAALGLLTKAWAAEFGPDGVRVNAVSPGPTRTEGTENFGAFIDRMAAAAPAGRPAGPGEIAAAITYLASDDASFVHGAILDVDGGRTAT